MSRQKKKPLSPWVTAKPDGMEKRFIQIGDTLVYHPAWLALSAGAKVLYLYMCMESGGKNEFKIPQRMYGRFTTKPTFQKSKNELIRAGFIEIAHNGANTRTENIYRFCFDWKSRPP